MTKIVLVTSCGYYIVQATAFSDIPAREARRRKSSIADKIISRNSGTINVSFLVDQWISLNDAPAATTVAPGLCAEIEARESGDGGDNIEES